MMTASSSTHVAMRLRKEEKQVLQVQAQKAGVSLSQYMKDNLVQLQPLPEIVVDALQEFVKASKKMSPTHIINCAMVSMMARIYVENLLYGNLLLNPFVVEVGEGKFFEDWDEVYEYFKLEYTQTLLDDKASAKARIRNIDREIKAIARMRQQIKNKQSKKD